MPINTNDKPTLDNLTEYQKSLLTRMSYLDINDKKFKALQQSGTNITVSDLNSLLSKPNSACYGDLKIKGAAKVVANLDISNRELLKLITDAGLGDLNIVDVVDSKSGFQAMCFSDSLNNTGFSFRGTDAKSVSSVAKDLITDVGSFLVTDTKQLSQANKLFNQYSNDNGNNYLYGYSLGGFLAENVYANNHENVQNTFVFNPLHIDQKNLNTQEKIAAFNNPEKFNCFITGGDYVSQINEPTLFEKNINYAVNNDKYYSLPLFGSHLIESATVNEDGNFVTRSKEEVYKNHKNKISEKAITIINNNKINSAGTKGFSFIQNAWNSLQNRANSAKEFINEKINNVKETFSNLFKKKDSIENNIHSTLSNSNYRPNNEPSSFIKSLNVKNWIGKNGYTEDNALAAIRSHPTKDNSPKTKSPVKDNEHSLF